MNYIRGSSLAIFCLNNRTYTLKQTMFPLEDGAKVVDIIVESFHI